MLFTKTSLLFAVIHFVGMKAGRDTDQIFFIVC